MAVALDVLSDFVLQLHYQVIPSYFSIILLYENIATSIKYLKILYEFSIFINKLNNINFIYHNTSIK